MHCEKHPVSMPENIPQRLFCSSYFPFSDFNRRMLPAKHWCLFSLP
jgi:hypothetical protein